MLWLIVGAIAAAAHDAQPDGDVADFWRNYGWLAGGVWLGAARRPGRRQLVVGDALVV